MNHKAGDMRRHPAHYYVIVMKMLEYEWKGPFQIDHKPSLVQIMAWRLVGAKLVGVGGFSKVVANLCHVGGSYHLFMTTIRDVWIIPSFQIWDYVLHVGKFSCVITNCGRHWWVIPSPLSIALWNLLEENTTKILISLLLELFFKFLLFFMFFFIAVFSHYFLLVGLLLQYVALFQSRETS